mgnify:FL=1
MEKPNHREWKVLSREYLARETRFTVRRDRVELPDGRQIPGYYVFEYPAWVNVLARTADGLYLFVSQYRHGLGETHYELVAGVSEASDAGMEAAARRELAEETGYGGGCWRLYMTRSVNPATTNNLTYCFLAEGVEWMGEPSPDATEDLDVHLLTESQVRELLCSDGIRQALHAAPLWKYAAERRWF